MVYAGTLVTHGRGRAVVVATGMSTEFGRIARLVETVEAGRTPLQENLDRLGATLGKAALVVVALIVARRPVRAACRCIEMFMFGIALAVAVVPEALPAVVTISLAIGVRRMVKRHALVRRLPVVETLGSTSVICSDKTGTLTKNEMTVRRLLRPTGAVRRRRRGLRPGRRVPRRTARRSTAGSRCSELLRAAVLASDAAARRRATAAGTSKAIPPRARSSSPRQGRARPGGAQPSAQPRVDEIPFTSERRRMTTLHETPDGAASPTRRARPKTCSPAARRGSAAAARSPLDRGRSRRDPATSSSEMAADGLRVLAIATQAPRRPLEDAERGMTLLGLVGMMDPPRAEARAAVQTCWAGRHHAR